MSVDQITIRPAEPRDAESVAAIYEPIVRETAISFETDPPSVAAMDRRMDDTLQRYPWLVAEHGGEIVGYAYVVHFRKRPAYRFTVKHSIYIHHDHVGQGIGQILMRELIDVCAAAGFRQIIGYIDADNTASLGLHEKFGFSRVGLLPGVAYRSGHWADTIMVQRSLATGSATPPPLPPPSLSGR